MRSDREMLMLAAKAAGIALDYKTMFGGDREPCYFNGDRWVFWNPLADDGDAFRLAVTARIDYYFSPTCGKPRGRTAFVAGATGLRRIQARNRPVAGSGRAIVARVLFDLRAGLTERSAELPAQCVAGRAPNGAQAVEGRHPCDQETR